MPATPRRRVAHATAPGGIGNMGPGLDLLGCAVTGLADEVWAERADRPGIELRDPGHPDLPTDPARHSAAVAAAAVLKRADAPPPGLRLTVRKGLPLAGGQGGSAASAVAGALAANALLDDPLPAHALLLAALEGEAAVAGRHADNVAPILLGGIVLVRTMEPLDVIALPVPVALRIVLACPAQRLRTADARALLPATVTREVAVHQAAQVGAVVAALASGDLDALGRAIDDRIAEPARARLLPGFAAAKAAALDAGAHGCSISGAGPSSFAFAHDDTHAARVAEAMRAAYERAGVACTTRLAAIDRTGARVEVDDVAGPVAASPRA